MEQTAERERAWGKMLTLLLHLCAMQIEGSNKKIKKKKERKRERKKKKKAKTEGTWEREKEGAQAREHV